MKVICILVGLLSFHSLGAAAPAENLDKDLAGLFDQLMKSGEELVGETYTVNLSLKVGTDRFLIFSDAYIRVDDETRYQIAKWIFTPDQTKGLEGKRGVTCAVTFRIEEIRTDVPYKDMPHFVATILSLQELDK